LLVKKYHGSIGLEFSFHVQFLVGFSCVCIKDVL
jgi:hypothetical protein